MLRSRDAYRTCLALYSATLCDQLAYPSRDDIKNSANFFAICNQWLKMSNGRRAATFAHLSQTQAIIPRDYARVRKHGWL